MSDLGAYGNLIVSMSFRLSFCWYFFPCLFPQSAISPQDLGEVLADPELLGPSLGRGAAPTWCLMCHVYPCLKDGRIRLLREEQQRCGWDRQAQKGHGVT